MPSQTKPPIDGVLVSSQAHHTSDDSLQVEAEKLFQNRVARASDPQTLLTELEHQGSIAVPCTGSTPVSYEKSTKALKEALRLVEEGASLEIVERVLEEISPVHGVREKARALVRASWEQKTHTVYTTVRACMDSLHSAYLKERAMIVSARNAYFEALHAQLQPSSFFEKIAFGGAEKERAFEEMQKTYNTLLDTYRTKGATLLVPKMMSALPREDALLLEEASSWYEALLTHQTKHAVQVMEEVALARTQKNPQRPFLQFLFVGYAWSASSFASALVPDEYTKVFSFKEKQEVSVLGLKEDTYQKTSQPSSKESSLVPVIPSQKESIPKVVAPSIRLPIVLDELPETKQKTIYPSFVDSEFATAPVLMPTPPSLLVQKKEEETEPTPFSLVAPETQESVTTTKQETFFPQESFLEKEQSLVSHPLATSSKPSEIPTEEVVPYRPRVDDFSLERVRNDVRMVSFPEAKTEENDSYALQTLFEKGVFTGGMLGARPNIVSLWRVLRDVPLPEVLNDIPGISYVKDGERVRLSKDTEALVYTMLCEIQEQVPSAVALVAKALEEKSTLGALVLRVAHELTKEEGLVEPFEKNLPMPQASSIGSGVAVPTLSAREEFVSPTQDISEKTPAQSVKESVQKRSVPPFRIILGVPEPNDAQVRFVVDWVPETTLSPLSQEVQNWVRQELGEHRNDLTGKTLADLLSQQERDATQKEFLQAITRAVLELEEVFVRSLAYRGEIETLLQGKEVSVIFPDAFETYTCEEALTAVYRQIEYYTHRLITS